MIDRETEHLMLRAEEEAVLAIRAAHPAAARAHHGLAVGYSTRAVIALLEEDQGPALTATPGRDATCTDCGDQLPGSPGGFRSERMRRRIV